MCKNTDPIGAAKPPMQSAENLPTNKDPGSVEAFLSQGTPYALCQCSNLGYDVSCNAIQNRGY